MGHKDGCFKQTNKQQQRYVMWKGAERWNLLELMSSVMCSGRLLT